MASHNDRAEGTPPVPGGLGFEAILGKSRTLHEALEHAHKVAASPFTTVLLVGETGTGKELFARGIHYAGTHRGDPFVAVNCAAIPETLLESELFGHEKGAFTGAQGRKQGLFELAGRGTLFLDEVHQLPHSLQPKLLRALETRMVRPLGAMHEAPVSCRIIAATNAPLEEAVAKAEFRPDLYYRLNVFRITLPPLRERDDDVPRLVAHFLGQLAREQCQPLKMLTPEAMEAVRAHGWPGNVRELKNVIERAAILSGSERAIRCEHLMIQQRTTHVAQPRGQDAVATIEIPSAGKPLAEIEREAVRLTLQITGGNQSRAARLLGISRPTLARIARLAARSAAPAPAPVVPMADAPPREALA